MCVGSVSTPPSYNDKNPPIDFFKSLSPFQNDVVLYRPLLVDWQDRLTLDPLWVSWELSAASGAEEDKMSPIKWLKCFVVGSNNEYSSRQLLLTSEPLKMQKININFALKGMCRSPKYINPKGAESAELTRI